MEEDEEEEIVADDDDDDDDDDGGAGSLDDFFCLFTDSLLPLPGDDDDDNDGLDVSTITDDDGLDVSTIIATGLGSILGLMHTESTWTATTAVDALTSVQLITSTSSLLISAFPPELVDPSSGPVTLPLMVVQMVRGLLSVTGASNCWS